MIWSQGFGIMGPRSWFHYVQLDMYSSTGLLTINILDGVSGLLNTMPDDCLLQHEAKNCNSLRTMGRTGSKSRLTIHSENESLLWTSYSWVAFPITLIHLQSVFQMWRVLELSWVEPPFCLRRAFPCCLLSPKWLTQYHLFSNRLAIIATLKNK